MGSGIEFATLDPHRVGVAMGSGQMNVRGVAGQQHPPPPILGHQTRR